jgi:hypothetical protein
MPELDEHQVCASDRGQASIKLNSADWQDQKAANVHFG